MKTYIVGGAVRDRLLGLPVHDHDWVVVGSTPEAMVAAGYTPVGRDFPVFLHPQTKEEYALARTERKSGRGYQGFTVYAAPEVTLEDDLARRDLTINAIAQDPASGALTDPFHGQRDLQDKLLRHVGPAFVDDPVRLLRLARLAARFPDFSVAPETEALLAQMVADGEVDALVPERVWQELSRGLMEARPDRMLVVLRGCGALARLLPEIKLDPTVLRVLQTSAQLPAPLQAPLPVRFALLCHSGLARDGANAAQQISTRWRVPTDCRELALLTAREHHNIHDSLALDPAATIHLLDRCDAWRRPDRFAGLLLACECAARAQPGQQDAPYPQRPRLLAALAQARRVDTAALAATAAAQGQTGPAIGQTIHTARVLALQGAAGQTPNGALPPERAS